MKNKIILNIMMIYILIITIIFVIQISYKDISAVEPLSTEMTDEAKLKNAVVLALNSPNIIIDEKQYLIYENDSTLVPTRIDGKIYIPVVLLETAFNANISFYEEKKETIIRLENKAMIFSDNKDTIKIIDNLSEEEIMIEESKIINDRFYIPIRAFAEVFDRDIFYNDDLIIISKIENIFDPIEEMQIVDELSKQVKDLPIVGNYDNLSYLLKKSQYTLIKSTETNLIKVDNLAKMLEKNKRILIKQIKGANFYVTNKYIEMYIVDKYKKETFSFKVIKENNNLKDIQMSSTHLIISYSDDMAKTNIYNIEDKENVQFIKSIENNGNIHRNYLDNDNLYSISKIELQENKKKLPQFYEYNKNDQKTLDEIINLENIHYFPDINDNSYTLITSVDLKSQKLYVHNHTYFGMGNNFIINDDNLYLITTNENNNNNIYLFENTFDGLKYLGREFIKGEFLNMTTDNKTGLLTVYLTNEQLLFDENLTIRKP